MQALHDLADLAAQPAQGRRRQAARGTELAAEHHHAAMARLHKAAQHAQQRRLARAVVADDGHALAGRYLQGLDVKHGTPGGVANKPFDLNHRRQRHAGPGHNRAARMRRLMASNANTIAITTNNTVANRPHWKSAVASEINKPSPPAPIKPSTVESRMLNSHT